MGSIRPVPNRIHPCQTTAKGSRHCQRASQAYGARPMVYAPCPEAYAPYQATFQAPRGLRTCANAHVAVFPTIGSCAEAIRVSGASPGSQIRPVTPPNSYILPLVRSGAHSQYTRGHLFSISLNPSYANQNPDTTIEVMCCAW